MLKEIIRKVLQIQKISYLIILISLLSALLTYIIGAKQISIIFLFIVTGTVYFIIVDRINTNKPATKPLVEIINSEDVTSYILNILIILVLLVCLLTLIWWGMPVYKPSLFYWLISLAYGLVFLKIALNKSIVTDAKSVWTIIIFIIIITSLLKWSFFIGIYQYEDDPGAHLIYIKEIASNGLIPYMDAYEGTPAFHIFLANISIISGIQSEYLSLVSSLLQSTAIIVIYLLARKISDNIKASLLAALIFAPLSLNLKYSMVCTTEGTSLVIILLLLLLYISYYQNINLGISYFGLLIPIIAATILWHYFYSFIGILWVIIVSSYLSVANRFNNYFKETSFSNDHWHYFGIIFIALMVWIANLMFSNETIFRGSVHNIKNLLLTRLLIMNLQPDTSPVASTTGFLSSYIIVYMSIFLLFTLAIAGGLFLLESRKKYKILMVLLIMCYSLVIVIPILANIDFLRPRIHFYFLEALAAILAGYAVHEYIRKISLFPKLRLLLIPFMAIFIVGMTFISITSRLGNELDPVFYTGDVPAPFHHSFSEKQILQDISTYIPENAKVVTDLRTGSRGSFPQEIVKPRYFSSEHLTEVDFDNDLIIINTDSVYRGMIFWSPDKGGYYGIDINRDDLNERLSQKNLILNGGVIQLYKDSVND